VSGSILLYAIIMFEHMHTLRQMDLLGNTLLVCVYSNYKAFLMNYRKRNRK
jgi:hypothetical protein